MVVYRTRLPDLPANRHQFVQRRSVNEISGVMLPVPIEVGCERIRADRRVLQKLPNRLDLVEGDLCELAKTLDESLNGNRLYRSGHVVPSRTSIAQQIVWGGSSCPPR